MKTMLVIFSLTILMIMSVTAQESVSTKLYANFTESETAENQSHSGDFEGDLLQADAQPDTVSGSLNETGRETKSFGFDYFPLKTDLRYNYESNAGDTEAQVREEKNELILTYHAGNITYEQQFFRDARGIYLTRTETKAFLFFGSKVTYPEPVLRLPLPLETGASWKWSGLETAGGDTGKLIITGEALGEEEVITPLGAFTCLKVRMRVESEIGSHNTITEWLAPNIGVVKFHARLEGSGITGFLQDLMGLDEITFDLASITHPVP